MKPPLLLVSAILLLAGCASDVPELPTRETIAERKAAGVRIGKLVAAATSIELLSLDPISDHPLLNRPVTIGKLGDWRIVGAAQTTDKLEIVAIARATKDAISGGKFSALCFFPHHAFRFRSASDEISILICFRCANGEIWVNGKETEGFVIDSGLEPTFDAIFAKHSLTITAMPTEEEMRRVVEARDAEKNNAK